MYGNEKGVGEAVRESGLDRGDVFVTSKLNNGFHAHDDALKAFDASLEALGFDYLDLFLIHWPLPGHRHRLRRDLEGAGGDLPQRPRQGDRRLQLPGQPPASGDPGGPSRAGGQPDRGAPLPDAGRGRRAANAEHGIATEAWSPIAQGLVLDDPVITGIAKAHGKYAGAGRAPLARPARRHRLPQVGHARAGSRRTSSCSTSSSPTPTWDVITALNKDQRTGPDPDEFNWIR